jgi:uncharacterized membrane protein (DUF4010 family)
MGLSGAAGAMLSDLARSPWPLVAVIFVFGLLIAVNYYFDAIKGKVGLTTKSAALFTVLGGALAYWNQPALAIALAVAATVLLSLKVEIHQFVHHLTQEDLVATLKFAVVTAIILPVLPNQSFGPEPFNILNPLKIWLFVVLISGISFVGYVLIKIAGSRKGIGLTGLFGGLASSTAVTLSFTDRSKQNDELAKPLAFAIILAWSVMFGRVIAAVAALNLALAKMIWLPMTICALVGLACCAYLFRVSKSGKESQEIHFSNPFRLGPALKFGFLFVLILLVSRVAQVYFGNTGIYVSSFFAGLADVDAIALSMAKLSKSAAGIDMSIAAKAIILSTVANTVLKGSFVIFGGSKAIRKAILPGFILLLIAGTGCMLMVK